MLTIVWWLAFFVASALIADRVFRANNEIHDSKNEDCLLIVSACLGMCSAWMLAPDILLPAWIYLDESLPQKGEDVHFLTALVIELFLFFVLCACPLVCGLGSAKLRDALALKRRKLASEPA